MPMLKHEVDLYYTEAGTGETIVFCHGAGGNAANWFQQFGAFMDDYRCVAYDCRGFGRSPCEPEAFDCAKFGADAVALLDHLGVDAAHFVCQSMGGWTGVQVGLDWPKRVKRLVLSDSIGGVALASGIESFRTMAVRLSETRLAHAAFAASYPQRNPASAFLYAQLTDFNPLPNDVVGSAMFDERALISLDRARTLSVPVLIFSGTDDVLWPPSVLEELAAILPTAQRVEIDSGHSPYIENPEVFNSVLRRFLERGSID